MRKLTLRSLWEHKRRLVATVVAIVLGVAFMSGTFVFADTIDRVFDDLFGDGFENVDARVQGVELFEGGSGFRGFDARERVDQSLVAELRAMEGIREARGFVQIFGNGSTNRILGADGDAIGPYRGPPTILESWIPDERLSPYTLREGVPPTSRDQVVLNVAAAEEGDLAIGDQVRIITQFGERSYELVGLFTFGEADSAAGATQAGLQMAEAQELAGFDGEVQSILVDAVEGISQEETVARIEPILPESLEVLTGDEATAQTANAVQSGFAFFRYLLVIFGAIALIVGSFIIANTFSILIAQRTRELALLRAIGASRRQVLGSVITEAAVIGLVAAVVGLGTGVALARAVTALLGATGSDIPTAGLVVRPQTVVLALVIGLGVTLVAAVVPAIQATRVSPLAAMRDVAVDRSAVSRRRMILGGLISAFGLFQLSAGWRTGGGSDALPAVGIGALATIIGAIVVGPLLAGQTVRVLGAALPRLRGITGTLATENAARSPKRTSATASALLIAVALIGFLTIFAASATTSIASEVENAFNGDLLIQSEAGGFGPPGGYPATVVDRADAVDGVALTSRMAFTGAQVTYPDGDAGLEFISAVQPDRVDALFDVDMEVGSILDLRSGTVLVDSDVAAEHEIVVGDELPLLGLSGQEIVMRVVGISDSRSVGVTGSLTMTYGDYRVFVDDPVVMQTILLLEPGTDLDAARTRLDEALADVPGIVVLDEEDFTSSLADQITSFLTFVNALLFLSVIIAMIGIANTLSLSVHERIRELGLLRAVGMTRNQLRSSIRWEAVLISVLGTLVGLGLGLLISFSVIGALRSFGLSKFDLPVGQLAFVVVIAALLGVVASVRPSRRAAKLDVLTAIATE